MLNIEDIISRRANTIKPSPTLAVTALAQKMKAEGKDVISLSAGEPDFDTPKHISDAGKKAIEDGYTKYTPVGGILELKNAILNKLEKQNNLSYTVDSILVSVGAKHSIFNCLQAIINTGDEVLIPVPYWVSYPDMALIMDGKPIYIEPRSGNIKITADDLKASLTDKSKVLIINSPSNPSGAVYTKQELVSLGKVIMQHPNLCVISDDIYEHIYWENDPFCNLVNACPDLKDRVIVINGVSKSYAMTGWRIGYAAGHPSIIKAMNKLQSQSTSNPCSISQHAAIAAINTPLPDVVKYNSVFKTRHDLVLRLLQEIDGVKTYKAQGSFYSFADFSEIRKRLRHKNDIELSSYILTEANVALVPGSAFGMPDFMRLSYATSEENIKKAIKRIKDLLNRSS